MEVALVPHEAQPVDKCSDISIVVANDLNGLAASARKTFQIFEPWSQAEFTIENDLLKDIVSFIKVQSQAYCRALCMSLRTSRNCVMLADGAISLCDGISEGRTEKELSASVDLLLEITKSGTEQAEEVVQKFRAVRQGLFQLTSRIPYAVEQVAFEIHICEVSKKRYQRASKHISRIQRAIAGLTETIAPVVAPIMSAAIPGLGVVLPVVLPLAALAAGKIDEHARSMIDAREKQQLACTEAIQRLEAISNDMGEVIEHVGKHTLWWQDMESTFRGLQSRVQSSSGSSSWDAYLLSTVKGRFSEIVQSNRGYISDITRLEDFFPKLIDADGFTKRITTLQPKDDLMLILQSITKSTHQYQIAYHRLRIAALDVKPKYRLSLDEDMEAIRRCLHAECESLHQALRFISRAEQGRSTDEAMSSATIQQAAREIREKLGALVGNLQETQAAFEACKRDISSRLHHTTTRAGSHGLLGHRHKPHEYKHLSHIMHGLVTHTDNTPPIASLEHAISQQNASIQDLVRFFNHSFSSATFNTILYTGESQPPIQLWHLEKGTLTEVMDKILVSADSLAKLEMGHFTL